MNVFCFIAFRIPDPAKGLIIHYKQELAKLFNIRHALKTEPHITLIPPFHLEEEHLAKLIACLKNAAVNYEPVKIKVDRISSFRTNRVIYLNVVMDNYLLKIQEDFSSIMEQFLSSTTNLNKYHPHITLANRDLTEELFVKVMLHLKDVKADMDIPLDEVVLYRHESGVWQPYRTFKLR